MKHKVGLLLAAVLLLSISTGFAAIQYFQLKDKDGNVVYQEKVAEEGKEDGVTITKDSISRIDKLNEIEEKMAEGTAASVFVMADNPDKEVDIINKPYSFDNLPALKQKVSTLSQLPEKVYKDFSFDNANVQYSIKDVIFAPDKMYKEAVKTKKDYVTIPLEMSDRLEMISIQYKHNQDKFQLMVQNFEGVKDQTQYLSSQDNEKTEKWKVNGTEALYSEFTTENGAVIQSIRWIKADTNLLYRINCNSQYASKAELLKIAEQF
ncbi:hypothetical protein [Brevibacillus sp. NRS-1366]|uniref:hypothetical protein n=1 Tax=Brevibacillus sp. NRS-1366 TaxID=3233899 RepID=UPI003D228767